jgi:hypothetical protein
MAIAYSETKNGNAYWLCICQCGRFPEVAACHLKTGHTASCGCFHVDRTREAKTTHGHSRHNGARRISLEYSSWQSIKARCQPGSAVAKYWGDLGIKVCERWEVSFENFLLDMGLCPGPGYSVDRRDSSKDYEPGNCHWATRKQQCENRARYGSWQERRAKAEELGQIPTRIARKKGRPTNKAVTP